MSYYSTYITRPHCMHGLQRCSLLLQLQHALCVCLTKPWAVLNWLNQSRCHLRTQVGPKNHVLGGGQIPSGDPPKGRGSFWGHLLGGSSDVACRCQYCWNLLYYNNFCFIFHNMLKIHNTLKILFAAEVLCKICSILLVHWQLGKYSDTGKTVQLKCFQATCIRFPSSTNTQTHDKITACH